MEESNQITSHQGLKLQTHSWKSNSAKLNLIIIHGLNDDSSSYLKFINELQKSMNLNIYTLDLPGHGASEGERGYIKKFSEYLDAVGIVLEKTKSESKLPIVILGHSMGGIIASQTALKYQKGLAGLILISPGFIPNLKLRNLIEPTAVLVSRIFPKLDISYFWNNKIKEESTKEILKLNLFAQLISNSKISLKHAAQITLPTLIIHGTKDPLADIKGSEKFISMKSTLTTFIKPPVNIHHLIKDDSTSKFVQKSISDWLRDLK